MIIIGEASNSANIYSTWNTRIVLKHKCVGALGWFASIAVIVQSQRSNYFLFQLVPLGTATGRVTVSTRQYLKLYCHNLVYKWNFF